MNDITRSMVDSEKSHSLALGRQAAQGLVEYGLAIGVVGVLAIAALTQWGNAIAALFGRLGQLIQGVG